MGTIAVADYIMFKNDEEKIIKENETLHAQWIAMEAAMATAQMHLSAATIQFQPSDDPIIMRHVEDAYRAIRECRKKLLPP